MPRSFSFFKIVSLVVTIELESETVVVVFWTVLFTGVFAVVFVVAFAVDLAIVMWVIFFCSKVTRVKWVRQGVDLYNFTQPNEVAL